MPAVPHKFRASVVELRTDSGTMYVRPSGWERIYLLWTFRNFRSLPKQVLNRHQQHLIDKLCQAAVVSGANEAIARTSIIGVVENIRLMPDSKTIALTPASRLVEMTTTRADFVAPRAVGSEGVVMRPSRAAFDAIDVERFRRRSGNVHYISAPQPASAAQRETKEVSPAPVDSVGDRTHPRNRLRWALGVVACCVMLLGILSYLRAGRLAPPILAPPMTAPQVAFGARHAVSGSVSSPAAAHPERLRQSVPVEGGQATMVSAINPPSPAVSSTQPENGDGKLVIPTEPSTANIDSPPAQRLQVAGAPERGFGYPVAPVTNLTGKVSLKALIGADGTVKEVEVLSGNRVLAGAAVRAVRHWRFRTYELNDHAVEAETNITISFVGDDAVSISYAEPH